MWTQLYTPFMKRKRGLHSYWFITCGYRFFIEPQNDWGWKGSLKVFWSKIPAGAGPPTARRETPQRPWAICPSAQSPSQWKKVSWCSDEKTHASVCAHCLLPMNTMKDTGCVCFSLSLQVCIYTDRLPPEPALLQAEHFELSQPLLAGGVL